MKQRQGNIWRIYQEADLFLLPGHAELDGNDSLIMKHGMMKQAARIFPQLPQKLGAAVDQHDKPYGLLTSPRWPAAKLGLFQIKAKVKEPASLTIIKLSMQMLNEWCTEHPDAQVHMTLPGVGYHNVDDIPIRRILWNLPNTVTIWSGAWEHHWTEWRFW